MCNVATRGLLAAMVLASLCACERAVVEGVVTDVRGEPLPGAVATVTTTGAQDLTDGRGVYRVPYEPGAFAIDFIKTGFTPGRLELDVPTERVVQAAKVMLWPLPPGKGVYLYADYRYTHIGAAEPRPYRTENQELVHGVKKTPEVRTPRGRPLIFCYKMPHYDWGFCRLIETNAALPEHEEAGFIERVLVAGQAIAIMPEPVDEPNGHLISVRLPHALDPGLYAVHWGAMDGYASTDPRAFVFEVYDPEAEQARQAEEAASGEPAQSKESE